MSKFYRNHHFTPWSKEYLELRRSWGDSEEIIQIGEQGYYEVWGTDRSEITEDNTIKEQDKQTSWFMKLWNKIFNRQGT